MTTVGLGGGLTPFPLRKSLNLPNPFLSPAPKTKPPIYRGFFQASENTARTSRVDLELYYGFTVLRGLRSFFPRLSYPLYIGGFLFHNVSY